MASTGDVLFIRVTQEYLGQTLLNTFTYQTGVGLSANVEDCLSEFKDTVWDAVRSCLSAAHLTTRFDILNTADNSEYYSENVNDQGNNAATGVQLPPQICVTLRSAYGGPGKRYTYHWFSGLKSAMLNTAGGQFISGYESDVAGLASALGSVLEGTDGLYLPVQTTGGIVLGTPATVSRTLVGAWSYNAYAANRRTRQNYLWLLPEA